MTIVDIILGFFKSKALKRFLWISFDGFLALIIVYLGGIDVWWTLPLIGIFQWLTKTINNRIGGKELKVV